MSMVTETHYEAPIEIGKSNERLDLLLHLGDWPVSNSGYLDWVHLHVVMQDDDAEVFNLGLLELALVRSEEQLVLLHSL